jgi:hypothetical protein
MSAEHSRRRVLQLGGLASLSALAGCAGIVGDDSDDGDGEPVAAFDAVPADTDLVATVDVSRLLEDDQARGRIEEQMNDSGSFGMGPASVPEVLDGVETELGLNPREISELLVFGRGIEKGIQEAEGDGDPVFAAIVDAEWAESDVQTALEENGDGVEKTSHSGQPLYRMADLAVGVLPDGRYVLSIPEVVRESIDVASGDADAVSGGLVDAFESTRSGYVRMAMEVSLDLTEEGSESAPVDPTLIEEVQYMAGAMYRDGESRGGEFTLDVASSDAAGKIADTLNSSLSLASMELENGAMNEQFQGDLLALVQATSIQQNGSTVVIENTDGRGLLPVIPLAVVGSFVLGLGGSSGPVQPMVNFEFEYNSGDGTVTIVHDAGDSVPASELYIRGTSLGATGRWDELDGSASGNLGGGPAVVAGDSLTLDAESDFEVTVVWEAQDESASAVMAEMRGPDA